MATSLNTDPTPKRTPASTASAPRLYEIIPATPFYQPTPEQERFALEEARRLLPLATPDPWRSDRPQVVGLFRSVQPYRCPRCGKRSKMSRYETSSFGEMLFVQDASEIMFDMPCCGASTTLAELRCAPDIGFARFGVSLSNLSRPPTARALAAVAEAMGSPVLLISISAEE